MNWGKRRSGYSLVELMVVVTIVGASVLAFAPGFSRAMADRRLNTATRELVRMGRRARAESMSYLRAHLVWIQPTGGTNGGPKLRLIRGLTNSCILQAWPDLEAACDATPKGPSCIEDHDIGGDVRFSTSALSIVMLDEALDGSTSPQSRAICYAPNGDMFYAGAAAGPGVSAPAGNALTNSNPANVSGGFVYRLGLQREDGTLLQPVRSVLFPLGGTPRVMR